MATREPRGIRNNNPGNIRAVDGVTWDGQVGVDDAGFVIFDTPDLAGIRALAKVLRTYYEKHGLKNIYAMLQRYAPPSENDTRAYAESVSQYVDFPVFNYIPPSKFKELLPRLVEAIIRHENGQQPYSQAQIQAGVERALA